VEIIEVGGSSKYDMTRQQLFPHLQPNALILVYDLTNRKSYNNLKKWLRELTNGYFKWADVKNQLRSQADHRLEAELADGQILPILLIGNKLDLVPKSSLANLGTTVTIDDIQVDALQIVSAIPSSFFQHPFPLSSSFSSLQLFRVLQIL
jgi:GTPase SAR1 family protein